MPDGGSPSDGDELKRRSREADRSADLAEIAMRASPDDRELRSAYYQARSASEEAHAAWMNSLMPAKGRDRSATETNRAEKLKMSQQKALLGPQGNRAPDDAGDTEESGSDPVERLRRGQAAAALEAAQGEAGGELDPREKIQGQLDRINHVLLVEILPEVVAFDASCLGVTTFLTLPLVYWPVAALWGLEVYNDFRGATTPFTPRLSWKSFMPPGTEINIPLPNQPLWIAWLAYVFLLVFLSLFWLGLVGLVVYAWNDPIGALGSIASLFSFF
jgi:hypothetical protein